MAVYRQVSMMEIVDRVLDKGIVIDGWLNVSVVGLDLIGLEGRMVVASLTTYAKRSKTVDRVLGRLPRRRTIAALPPVASASAVPAALTGGDTAPATTLPAAEIAPAAACPRCRKRNRRQDVVLVTVQTNTETRVTARCSVCGWQHTRAR